MAFISMVFVGIFLLFILGCFVSMIVFLILGIVKHKQKNKSSKVFFILFGVLLIGFILLAWLIFFSK